MYFLKTIPTTSIDSYISGWELLNSSNREFIFEDWHTLDYWYSKVQNKTLKTYKKNHIFKDFGVKEREFIAPTKGIFYSANKVRALADLIFEALEGSNPNLYLNRLAGDIDNFLDDFEKKELITLLEPLLINEELLNFIKKEMPKQYYECILKGVI